MTNFVTGAGYLVDFVYYGEKDKDIQLYIDKIKNFDPSFGLRIFIESKIHFKNMRLKQLFEALKNKLIKRISISDHCLNNDQSRIVLDFLNSPEADYTSFVLQFKDAENVTEALRAVENRYSFDYGHLTSKDPVSKEAEELASKIAESHPSCMFELNSDIKLIMPMEKRGFMKYHCLV